MKYCLDHLRRYYLGNRSFADTVSVCDSLGREKCASRVEQFTKKQWQELCQGKQELQSEELKPLFYKIQYLINKKELERKRTRRIFMIRVGSIAASILIPISIMLFLKFGTGTTENEKQELVEVFCPPGTRTHFNLPDGSSVWMNGGSKISYSQNFTSKRDLNLSGEAFFDVIRNTKSPFVVTNKGLHVCVLGTQFNVMGYDDSQSSEIVLVSGSVAVNSQDGRVNQIIKPNQKLVISLKDNKISRSWVNGKDYALWKEGVLFFDNENLKQVVDKISRYYNVDVDVNMKGLESQRFRAKIPIGNLDELMRYLKLTIPLDYRIIESSKQKNQMISKRKVIIKKRV